ncbi:MAG TPA: CAP domain-containing protein [Acidimicrobiales bacterium]|nr:CAP domain-containing protein [Acidimicrobiales bacterium]
MRRRAALAAAIALLLVFVVPVGVTSAGASADNPAADEAQFVALINATRAKGGLPPLTVDAELTGLARDWSEHMASGGCGEGKRICHASPISAGVTAQWQKLGENVGTGPAVQPVMDAFIASAGHYANIMDPAFTRVGVGVVWAGSALYTTHRFMKVAGDSVEPPEDDAPAPPPSTARKPRVTTTTAPPAPTTTTTPSPAPAPPPPAAPSRVAVVLLALRAAAR